MTISGTTAGTRDSSATLPPAAPRLEYIDGLRALAALWVALHHVLETSTPTVALRTFGLAPLLRALSFGQFPVMIFLMLSGFCLYYPYVKRNPHKPEFNTTFLAYLKRRFTRIAPPYLWAGALCIGFSSIPGVDIGRWRQTVPIDAAVIGSHLLFIHNLIPSHSVKIDYPMWSIGLEWQLYLFFPLLVLGFRRANAWFVTIASLLVAAAVHATYHRFPAAVGNVLREGPLAYLEIFSIGMVAASLTVRRRTIAPKWLLATVAVVGFVAVRLGNGNGLGHDLEVSAAAFSILLLAVDADGVVARTLSTPWLVNVGIFSYSLYLVHAPLLHLCWLAIRPLGLSSDATFFVLALVGLPAIVVASYGFHCLFERPFMRVRPRPQTIPVGVAGSAQP